MLCKRWSVLQTAHPNYSLIPSVHFNFLCFTIQHLTSLNLLKILHCQSPIASGRHPCSFFHGCSWVMPKCFASIPQLIHSLTGLQDEKTLLSPSRSREQRGLQEATEKHSRRTRTRSMGAHRCFCVSVHISKLHWSLAEVGGGSHCSSLTTYIPTPKGSMKTI